MSCSVRYTDKDGVIHEVDVQAETLFEAAAVALRSFRQAAWSAEGSHWTGALEVSVKQPEVVHRVMLDKLQKFVDGSGGSPAERMRRIKVKGILDGGDQP